MKILAIETSCDETAVAIVEDGRRVLSSVIASQADLHSRYGGVVPEVAAREHIEAMSVCLETALTETDLTLEDIDAFAATLGPGLVGALLVGANTAKTLSLMTGKPFRGVNHLEAHVASNYLESDLKPPFVCLLVSGGHTQLRIVEDYTQTRLMGETLDDAIGEAYDKVARLLELPYPGGPNLDKLANGLPDSEVPEACKRFPLPKANTDGPYDFSFSGVKTACLRAYEKTEQDDRSKAQLAAAFQKTVVDTLVRKTLRCAQDHSINQIAVAGGVSANSALRQALSDLKTQHPKLSIYRPDLKYCTDNAAMVGAAAFYTPLTEDIRQEVFSRA